MFLSLCNGQARQLGQSRQHVGQGCAVHEKGIEAAQLFLHLTRQIPPCLLFQKTFRHGLDGGIKTVVGLR